MPMNIKHIDCRTNLPCIGFMVIDGITILGTRYRCSYCGKTFVVDMNGNIVL